MKRNIVLSIVLLVLFSGSALAVAFNTTGNPADTPAGTPITLEAAENTLDYKDLAGNPRPTVNGETIPIVTGREIGYSSIGDASITFPFGYYYVATPGSTETLGIFATNEGNAQLTAILTLSAVSVSLGGNGWSASIWDGGTNSGSAYALVIPDNSDKSLELRLIPATTESGSPDTSFGTFEVTATTEFNTTSGSYTGANMLTYGGADHTNPFRMGALIEAPVIAITRTATIDSPSSYEGWGEGTHTFVPGALWTYTITYTNEGTGNAANVAIIDKVPANCVAYKINVSNPETNVIVTIPTMEGNVIWYLYNSTQDTPSFTHYNAGHGWGNDEEGWYGGMGAVGLSELITPPYETEEPFDVNARLNMRWVKFQTPSMEAGATGTIQWSVYIK